MEAGTMGMPNGIHGAHANGAPGVSGAFSPADVIMSELPTAEASAEAAKATATPDNGQIADASAPADVMGDQQADPSGNATQAVSEPKEPLLEAFDSQQEAVTADPGDFDKWVKLIGAAEKLANIARIRQVYNAFFREYPLCFGYWKKYADAEQRHASIESAVQVYERGVAAVAYSPDLWGQYAVFKQNTGFSAGAVLSVFERGAQIVGRDPGSHGFWDKFIRYADSLKEPHRVAAIYKRALGQPLKQLDKYMTGLTEYVEQQSVAELIPVASVRAALEAEARQKQAAAAEAARQAAAEAQAASAAAAAAQAAEAAAAAASQAEEPPAAPVIGPPEAPRAVAEAAAAAPHTPPTSSETGLFEQPAPAAVQASLADHVGPVTPPPGSSSQVPPAPGSAQLRAPADDSAQAEQPAPEDLKMGQGSAHPGFTAPTHGEAGPVDPAYASAASAAASQEPQPMQVDDAATNGSAHPPVSEADLKEALLASCRTLYESTKEELTRRNAFEAVIRRPYFHVKPLDAAQLSAWSHYLDYMDAKGDEAETRHLFERCLVACARYTDFWMRYTRYLEPKDVPAAKHAVHRGQSIHCKGISEMQLFAARFHERHGDVPKARAAYGLVLGKLAPSLISAVLAHANFERRQGDRDAACSAYQKAIAAAAERGTDGEKTYVYLTVQYAHFLMVVYKDVEGARAVYSAALEKLPRSLTLWEGAIHLEQIAGAPVEATAKSVLGLYQRAIASADLLPSDKEDLSARACTFADMCGSAAMQEAAERLHAARVKSAADASTSASGVGAKRPAETFEAHSPSKQARGASAAYPAAYSNGVPAPMAAPAAPVASAAGYYGQPAAGYQYPGYAYPGYGQPGYPAYSYPQY